MGSHAPQTIGYSAAELAESPYSRFFSQQMRPLPDHVQQAVLVGGVSGELMPGFDAAGTLLHADDWLVETGYSICDDREIRVSVRTLMPGVTPAMWDWWFAWHGSDSLRYKLWHPRAHVHAVWGDNRSDLTHYVGRTSHIVEYIGSSKISGAISFVPPASIGIDESRLAASGATAICARTGLEFPQLDAGWLVHYVRPVAGGSEMRSRFWMGGGFIAPRGMDTTIGKAIGRGISQIAGPTSGQARDLLVHCAQEMNHLAAILPDIYAAFGPQASL